MRSSFRPRANRIIADEYDSAQKRGEVVGSHSGAKNRVLKENAIPTAADLGLSRKQIHEARIVRDAEARTVFQTGEPAPAGIQNAK